MPTTQANRAIKLTTPFGGDVLLLQTLVGREALSRPFQFELLLASERGDLDADEILGTDIAVSFIEPRNGAHKRYLGGFVTEFAQIGYDGGFHQYRALVRPWFWFLTRSADCRIFQNKTVPQIFEEVVKAYGIAKYKLRLSGSYESLEYCVQYRETDFDFLNRLLEREGICYYFEHSEGGHVMVLADGAGGHDTVAGYEAVPYYAPALAASRRERDHLSAWSFSKAVQPGVYATTDYDFEKPSKSLAGNASISRRHVRSEFEIFDYPAGLAKPEPAAAKSLAQRRIEELQATHMVARGSGDAAGLAPGFRFKLEGYPRGDLNIEYLVSAAEYRLVSGVHQAGGGAETADEFFVRVEAIDARTPFRPARVTPKPIVQGAQTAIVVGKQGNEIYTDEYGRVKVQFHWDRESSRDENSSCWIRVAQLWAGKNWGAMHIPRVGQEVIVSFLEGDPDRPIVTGRVYNGDAMPPYGLPDNATRSGLKSVSTPDGTASANFNELRFEDKKGEEEIYLHAEKNLTIVVENDQRVTIGKDKRDPGGRTTEIHQNDTLNIGSERSTTVEKDDSLCVKGARTMKVDQDATDEVGKSYVLKAGDQITLQTGAAKIVMQKNGDIEISGKNVRIKGSAQIEQSATQKLTMDALQVKVSGTQVGVEGQKTEIKGTILDLAANGIASLKGSLTKIG